MVLILLIGQPVFAITQNYDMEIDTGDGNGRQSMIVSTNNDHVEVIVIDHKKEKNVVQFKNKTEFQKVEYVNGEGKKFLEVVYDYVHEKINISGNVNNEYPLKESIYDNNGSLFYLFSQIFPKKNETMTFTLLQSKLDRKVGMYLKQVCEEELTIGGKKLNAIKYEMGLSSKITAAFWPHKYYYWYSANDRRFLKYEGLGENKKIQTIRLVNYKEN
ncbi:MAG: hypothetical protein OEV78_02165 [Spirochaetia bacterium]|nr:hypothetical protein [Spirochaetia bacterium]